MGRTVRGGAGRPQRRAAGAGAGGRSGRAGEGPARRGGAGPAAAANGDGGGGAGRHSFSGRSIPHVRLGRNTSVSELVDIYARTGYNGRKLGEAAQLYARMIDEGATVCLTVSGAMTPVGFGGIFKDLIERGFVDWIVTTGANVYHEDHFAWGLPVRQGHHEVDDMVLYDREIVRIRDVYIKFYETLEAEDQVVQKAFKDRLGDGTPFTTAEFCNALGGVSREHAPHPDRSFVAAAHEYDVPVYVSTLKDSSLALNLAVHRLRGRTYSVDVAREVLEQAAIVHGAGRSGILELGGGVPKNTAQQTGPLLDQILRRGNGGQDYIIQITDARPDTGGLSGATLQEGKSWGKVRDAHEGMVTVYADATVALPLIALYAIKNCRRRRPKRLYRRLGGLYESLKDDYFAEPDKFYGMLDDTYRPKGPAGRPLRPGRGGPHGGRPGVAS